MADCANCGAPLPEGQTCEACDGQGAAPVRRKRHSFSGVCGRCGALLPAGCENCLVCGTASGEVPFQGEFPVPAAEEEQAGPGAVRPPEKAGRKTPDIWRRWGGGVSAAVLVLVLAMSGLGIYRQYFDTSSHLAAQSVVYENSGGRLVLSHPGLETPREVVGIERPAGGYDGSELHASPNGRWIAYTDRDGDLYTIDLAQRGVVDSGVYEAERIAGDLDRPAVFSANSEYLVYLTRDNELYASDRSEIWRLDTSVVDILAVDNSYVLYTRQVGNQNGQVDLYLDFLPKDSGEWLLIDRGITEVLDWTSGFERMLYTGVRQDENGNETDALLLFELNKDTNRTTILAENVGKVLDASAETGTVVYLIPQRQTWSYSGFVEDDLLASDLRMRAPDLEDYPLVADAIALYGEGGEFTDSEENEELILQNNRYEAALQEWEDKQARDALRRELRQQLALAGLEEMLSDLYIYRNGELVLLDTGIWEEDDLTAHEGRVSAEKGYVAYQKIAFDTLKKVRVSTMWDSEELQDLDVRQYFLDNVRPELKFASLNTSPVRLFIQGDSSTFHQWRVAAAGDGVYFTVAPRDAERDFLYYMPVRGGTVGDAVLLSSEADGIAASLRDGILFVSGGAGEQRLHFAQGDSVTDLGGAGIRFDEPVNNGGTLLFYDGYDEGAGAGTLYLLARELRQVGEGIARYRYISDELVYSFKREGESASRNVYLWQNGRERLVDADVNGLVGIPTE